MSTDPRKHRKPDAPKRETPLKLTPPTRVPAEDEAKMKLVSEGLAWLAAHPGYKDVSFKDLTRLTIEWRDWRDATPVELAAAPHITRVAGGLSVRIERKTSGSNTLFVPAEVCQQLLMTADQEPSHEA